MVVYLSKPMIMRINHMWGHQGWDDLEWRTWLRGTDDVLVVGLHMVGKRVKVSSLNNVTSFLALYFSFTWFNPLISFLPLLFCHFILVIPFILSYTYIYIFLTFLFFFLSSAYTYFSLYFSLSWHLFSLSKALNSSLSRMHSIWNFK
jgi:hypothetical protein